MFQILNTFFKRKFQYYHFTLLLVFSFLLAFIAVVLQNALKTPFMTIFILLSCLLCFDKKTDAFLRLKKFNVCRLDESRQLKLAFFLYLKRNVRFYFVFFYSLMCLFNFTEFVQNFCLISSASLILLSNLLCKEWAERIATLTFSVLILFISFKWGNYYSLTSFGIIFSSMSLLLPNTFLIKNEQEKKKCIVFSAKTNVLLRHFVLAKWKANVSLLGIFCLPLLLKISVIEPFQSFHSTLSYTGIFSLMIYFEILQDLNLEKQGIEQNKLRLSQLGGVNFFKRFLLSDYFCVGGVVMLLSLFLNLLSLQFVHSGIQISLILLLSFWYKFFEEKALIQKRKPTWQLSYIRSWIPSTLIGLLAFAPQLIQVIHKMRGR